MERLIIIGSGPAGLTAAIYAARANLAPVVFAGYQYGGQLMFTTEVENYPGFPNGILGPELMESFRSQAERFGASILNEDVTRVDFSRRPFRLWAGDDEYEADSVIVATGASARWLNIPGEANLRGRGVSTCATCDGAFFKDRHIVVVGGGDSAMEEALFLTRFGSKVTLIHRRESFRASKIMSDRALAHPKIDVIWNTAVVEAKGEFPSPEPDARESLDAGAQRIAADAIFIAIGHDPNTEIFADQLELDTMGYIVSPDGVHTNVPGVFVGGDVYDIRYKQAITAAGMGCKASLEAEKYLGGTRCGAGGRRPHRRRALTLVTQAQTFVRALNVLAKSPQFSYTKARAAARKEAKVDVGKTKAVNEGFNPDVAGCETFVMLDGSVCEWRAGSFTYHAR